MADSTNEIRLLLTGEDVSARSSLEQVSKVVSDLSEQLTTIMRTLGEATKSMSDFGRGATDVKDSIATASGSLTRFSSNVSKQATTITEGTDKIVKSIGDVATVSKELGQDTRFFTEYSNAMNSSANASAQAAAKIREETAAVRANTDAQKAGTSATRQSKHDSMLAVIAMQMIGGTITAVGYKGAHMFVGAISSAMNFQAMMSRVGAALKTTGGDTSTNLKNLSALAMKLDQTSLFSMNDIGDSMQSLAKQGLSYKDIYSGAAQSTITLAQATDSSLTDTGTVVTDVMHEFGLKGNQLTPVINAISGALHQANISMSNFYNSMKYAGPVASKLGMSVTDVSTVLGDLAQHGIKSTQAGTTLRRMFLNLQPHTVAATSEMQKLGLMTANGSSAFFDATGHVKSMGTVISLLRTHLTGLNPVQKQSALNTMFGTYALSGMTVIAGTTAKQWSALQTSMKNTSAAEVAAQKMDNLKGHLKEFTSTLQTIGTNMAMFLMPAIDKIVVWLQKLAGAFKDLSPTAQHIIFAVMGIGTVLTLLVGTLLTVASTMVFLGPGFTMMKDFFIGNKLVTGIRSLITSMGLLSAAEDGEAVSAWAAIAPWALILLGIAALGVGIYELITHWKAVSQATTDAWNAIKQAIIPVIDYVKPYIINAITAISTFWKQIWPQLQTVIETFWKYFKLVVATLFAPALVAIQTLLSAFQASWKTFWNVLKDALKTAWDLIVGVLKAAWDVFSGVIKIGLDLLTGQWGKAWQDLVTMVKTTWTDLSKTVNTALTDLQNLVVTAIKGLVQAAIGAFQGLIDGAKKVWSTITGIFGQKVSGPTVSMPTPSSSASSTAGGIPHFAAGGIVRAPTIALIGEAGPEMVVPLNGVNQSSGNYSLGLRGANGLGTGSGVNIGTIVIQTQATDASGISKAIKQQVQRALV